MTARGEDNFLELRLRGRIPIENAATLLIFKQGGITQKVVHQIKYNGDERLAVVMGRKLGTVLAESGDYDTVDMLVPVPLHRRKERKRGYNQSLRLCEGIQQAFPRPVVSDNLIRSRHTDSQTHKNRQQRLENMKDVFNLRDNEQFAGKHLLLVDDVITTGATTEACCQALLTAEGVKISIASLAVTGET